MKKIVTVVLLCSVFCLGKAFSQGCESASSDDEAIKLFGFFQPQFDFHSLDGNTDNTFKFKRARIGVTGNIPYDFSYYMVIENSAFVGGGNPYLLDAFISYSRFKWATVSVGSFKQPFGMEVNTSCSALNTIERSMVSDQIIAPQRDMGLMILGGDNTTFLKYAVALMNGTGLGVTDNNNKKDLIGRATIKPLDFLRFGGSFRYGFPANDSEKRITYAGELEVNYGDFLLQGEYIMDSGDENLAAGGGCGADPLILGDKSSGGYVQLLYMTPFRLQPVVKYEMFDRDLDTDNNSFSTFTAGANYFFNDWTRLQVNYRYTMDDAGLDPTEIKVQLQVKF